MNKGEAFGLLCPYIRFFNASPQGGSMDLSRGNIKLCTNVEFGHITPYIKTPTSPTLYRVTRSGRADDTVDNFILKQNIGEVSTICTIGMADKCEIMTIKDDEEKVNREYAHIRICNLSPEAGGYDIYANGSKILMDIRFKEISRYMEIRPEEYEMSLCGDKKSVLSLGKINLKQGKFSTLYIIGLKGENPRLSGIFTDDANSREGFYL